MRLSADKSQSAGMGGGTGSRSPALAWEGGNDVQPEEGKRCGHKC